MSLLSTPKQIAFAEVEKSTALITLRNAVVTYQMGESQLKAVNDVSLEIHKGEFLALAGPSGSGKTTILNVIGCIETLTSGELLFGNLAIRNLNDAALSALRSKFIGFIFQQFNLIPVLSALENVEYPLIVHPISAKERRVRAKAALAQVGLERFEHHQPMKLSGGQRQRVAIARALVTRPALILADEPTANLDHRTGEEILTLMQKINQDLGTTFVFSTHDPKVMARATRIIPLLDGRIEENV